MPIISPILHELLGRGRFTVYSPSKERPDLVTVVYLSGDMLCFANPGRLQEQPELVQMHVERVHAFIRKTKLPLIWLKRIWATVIPVISLLGVMNWDEGYLLKLLVVAAFSVLGQVTKSAMARLFLKLFTRRLRQKLDI